MEETWRDRFRKLPGTHQTTEHFIEQEINQAVEKDREKIKQIILHISSDFVRNKILKLIEKHKLLDNED